MPNIKCKNMMYEQQIAHLPFNSADDLYKTIESKVKPKKMAMITHDKDTDDKGKPTAPHVHVMMSFDNARSITHTAKTIGDKDQYIAAWNDKASNGFAYLVHRTEKAKSKYQYDPSDVKANFDYVGELARITQNVQKAKAGKAKNRSNIDQYLNEIYNGNLTKKDVESKITGSEYARYKKQIEDVDAKRLQKEAEAFMKKMREENRSMEVYWIYGRAGTGKTSLAKRIAENKGGEYFISGSTRDMFQDYNGEHTIILDELRPNSIPYADLLRITDPYAERVHAPSRYHDKNLAVDLMIITTPYSPIAFYNEMNGFINKAEDSFGQMERRLTLTIYADLNAFYFAEYDSSKEEYQIDLNQIFPNTYSKSARIVQSTPSAVDLFNDLMVIANTHDTDTVTDTDADMDTVTDITTDTDTITDISTDTDTDTDKEND